MAESTSQVQQPAASPSPPPPAPIPQTPGPRASRLHQVFDQALARTLRANSYQNFASCFPTPARHVPASLEGVWRQLNAKLEANAKAEFEDIVAERDAIPHLNELDRLVNDAKARKEQEAEHSEPQEHVVYVECVLNLDCYFLFYLGLETNLPEFFSPHTLGAEDLYKAHITPFLEEAQSTLNSRLEATNAENAELAQTVQAQRLEIEQLLSHLGLVVSDIEGAAAAATQFSNEHHIRQDAVQMDQEANARPAL
ncbi:unnamed protein product [Penicillium salamii]|uniref:MIND kinetochore complex component Nnf1 n=1 Tax=Penicillium salamii TaxID=1612424 RepID=A0A9W4NCP6_9EURO|nr:unnamed protein product [Penicillium salamii]CAG7995433.1 unnamed protein product [Penicillium salamii]CAG8165044.1 unnamed protein product [Penicillium salamii]CAG8192948.1 unnamed protein product [Penicillium salamii]CAG8226768.1 unnamed protein product [Penicillium salamii]